MQSEGDFDELYEASRDRLTRQLFALTGDLPGAEDLVQEAFVRTWMAWGRVSSYACPEAFVRRVAFNLAKSRWRGLRRTFVVASVPEAGGLDPDPFRHGPLVAAMSALTAREREALVLHYLADLSVAEVADEMGASAGTVKSWLSRGRVHVATRLEPPCGPAAPQEEANSHG